MRLAQSTPRVGSVWPEGKGSSVYYGAMPPILLSAGLATGIGSLPHHDPTAAAASVMRWLPRFPAAPQLPSRTPLEGMIAQSVRALPEVTLGEDGLIARIDLSAIEAPIVVG